MRGKFDFLKERAEQFFEEAEHCFQQKNLELCAFNLEQSCQLFLKYVIGKQLGDFPHIHSLPQLMRNVAKVFREKDLLLFYEKNKQLVGTLEKAYFEARYYDTQFELSQVEDMLKFTKELKEKLQSLWN